MNLKMLVWSDNMNNYLIQGDTTILFIKRRSGEVVETMVDTEDLPRLVDLGRTWCVASYKGEYYVRITYEGTTLFLHTFLIGNKEGYVIDHKDNNPLNNKKINLRHITNAENQQNRNGAYATSRSGIRGVGWHEKDKKWRARIYLNKKEFFLGNFDTIDEAEQAVKEARRKYMPFSEE